MISLVAYENSDSEDDTTKAAKTVCPDSEGEDSQLLVPSDVAAAKPLGARHGDASGSNASLCPAYVSQSGKTDGQYRGLTFPNFPFGDFSFTPCPVPASSQNLTGPGQSSRLQPPSSGLVGAPKRPQFAVGGVRPYIPKRQRLLQVGECDSQAVPCTEAPPTRSLGPRLLTEVSESVRPYLGRRYSKTELPRCARLHLQAHQGPVNTVQWCPVPQFSHLLLSASMDKTVKVWDGAGSGRCVQMCCSHTGAVKDACWTPCGTRILSGSFDSTARLSDVETGQQVSSLNSQFKVTSLAIQPSDPNVFLCGGFSAEVKAWDLRSSKVVRSYQAGIQQTLDILFLAGGKEFVTSSDAVSRDSAERTLIAWDFQTTAKVSNQIFHERYTCPSLALHPTEDAFVAQTNGNYIALFSAQRPFRMNKKKRYEGHKVEGYAVGCEFSPDGFLLATGSSCGAIHFYNHQSARTIKTLQAHKQACICVTLHPVIPAVAATCDWGGEIKIWSV
ncbi:WDR25 protein, partial [Amia calva]|nr:WDR25 protein [Amia calva]